MVTQGLEKNSAGFVSAAGLFAFLGLALQPATAIAAPSKSNSRISHAKELLGPNYKKSIVRKTEKTVDICAFVTNSTKKLLPKNQKKLTREIASTIIRESERYGFDPIFLMAVIQNESSFNTQLKGSVGEIGLMQIKPETAEWIAKEYNISYQGERSLFKPETNIKIGAAFLNKLRHQFDSNSGLYISAYNAGARKVRIMVSENMIPKIYASAVMKRYLAIYSGLNAKGSDQEKGTLVLAALRDVTRI